MEQFGTIKKKFEKIGARLKIRFAYTEKRFKRVDGFQLDVGRDRKGEFFDLLIGEGDTRFDVTDVRSDDRHLILMADIFSPEVKTSDNDYDRVKFLCGHDERHLFIAGVPEHVSDVYNAMQSLKPAEVLVSQGQNHVIPKLRNRRRNKGFVRQGEWYFVPTPELDTKDGPIYRNEPINRGLGKSHWVQYLYRKGGVTVHVCAQYPAGLKPSEYDKLIREDPEAKKYNWRMMQREAEAYGMGHVSHPDHKTIYLNGWHRILMNKEVVNETGSGVQSVMVFLD
ncbi:MAG: hypothetical protein GF307_06060 [candidate division Zixibacteria bacterium]|nr:hypothetical protein [candidate division Zixibacteria bacterium]